MKKLIPVFSGLRERLVTKLLDEGAMKMLFEKAYSHNGWFTAENIRLALENIVTMLKQEDLEKWVRNYPKGTEPPSARTIALILAGNIPLAGFHDLMCVLFTGNKALIKMSSSDEVMLPWLYELIIEVDPSLKSKISFTESKLENFDAVIATGTNNSSRYFEYYFKKYPHVFRKNRNSVAVLTGRENAEQLSLLGRDIFDFFGLGCRNVSKLYVPYDYNFKLFFEAIHPYADAVNNKKYGNNYDYHRTILLMNKTALLDNNFILLKEDPSLQSPISVLHYAYYHSKDTLSRELEARKNDIQCIVSDGSFPVSAIPFGSTQSPRLWDYADGMDTIRFLQNLQTVKPSNLSLS